MKRTSSWMSAIGVCVSLLGAIGAHAALTDGYTQYTSTYNVQNWTSGCGGFANLGGGEYETWVCSGESRVEMRWENWPNQNTFNQFVCDAMFSPQTQNTCIHQIKSNTGGEVIYLQVQNPGTLRNDNGSVFLTGMSGVWFHINSMFNPVTGMGYAYINGSLEVTRSYPTSDRAWYFKNGCYNNGIPSGGKSTAWFKNITTWVLSSSPNFSISASPSSQTITAGNAASYTTSISAINGFGSSVSLSVSGLPSNASASFNPASVSGSGNSTLTVNTTTSTPAGTYTLTITGTSGSLTHSTTVSLTVNAAPQPDFSLSASPTSLSITQGNNGTSTITINPVNGYNNTVSLSASGLPSGVTASFNPGSTTSSSTLTLTASSTAATGTVTVTITGTDGTLTHTTTISLTVNAASGGLPAGWTDTDIGSVGIAGSASYSGGVFTVSGSGADIWGTADSFNYAYQSISGDQIVIARVASENGTASYAKSGVMIRESTASGSVFASVLITPANGVAMEVRPTTGASAINLAGWIRNVLPPQWVKLVRSGSTFTGYYSADGSSWTQISSTSVTMATSATAGLAVTAHDNTSLNTATFDNVSISGSAPAPDFSLSASPTSLTITQGANGTSTITINPVNGYNNTVSLSASGLPSGVTALFNPSSTTSSSTLTLSASSTAATGTATVTITGTDGTLTHTTTISLTVNATVNFSGIYQIQNEASGLVLNNQGKLTNGSPITQWTSVASSNLDWQFFPTSNGYYQINSCKSALDAVVQSASTAAGAGIIQWSFGSSGDDQWQPQANSDGSYTFVNLKSGLVLADPGGSTSTSTQMDQETATGGSNQKWMLLLQ